MNEYKRARGEPAEGRGPSPDAPKDRAEVVTLPPLIYLCGVGVGYVLEGYFSTSLHLTTWRWPFAIGVVLAGAALALWSELAMRRHHTSPLPWKATTAIATDGPYGLTRNPLYVAQALIHVGVAIAVDSLWILLLLAPVLVVVRYGVIGPEEQYLARKFGNAYREYTERVRRWV